MTDITGSLERIQVEETQYKSAISEATAQKIGGTVNWLIDEFQSVPAIEFTRVMGEISLGANPSVIRVYFPFAVDIKAVSMTMFSAGVGATAMTFDFKKNATTSLLSTPISVSKGAGFIGNSSLLLTDDTEYSGDVLLGIANTPTMTKTSFLAGEFIEFTTNRSSGDLKHINFTAIGNRTFP